jgi:AAA domain
VAKGDELSGDLAAQRQEISPRETGIGSDTLAKLTWSVQRGELPEWAAQIGPSTLVIIDEAGMADTLTLDTAVQFVIQARVPTLPTPTTFRAKWT